jgi:hypothetical protein
VVLVFSIIGLAASILALFGLLPKPRASAMTLPHACALILVIAAWWAGHLRAIGWVSLIAAGGIELAVRARRRNRHQPVPETTDSSGAQGGTGLSPDVATSGGSQPQTTGETAPPASTSAPLSPAPLAPPFTTCALLRAGWEPSGEVFLASLRRGGSREAEMVDNPTHVEAIQIRVGSIMLELASQAKPMSVAEIEYAASQSWEWPDALAAVSSHLAHVLLTTRTTVDTPRVDVVRLHHRAHVALAEFAPVVAVMWLGAGRLVPLFTSPDHSADAETDAPPLTLCVNFRMFPPSEAKPGQFVSDSVGLHAFGLPDVQIATTTEPNEVVSSVLYTLAERFFTAGYDSGDGSELDLADLGRWRVARCRATFEPNREVIELEPAQPVGIEAPPEMPAG